VQTSVVLLLKLKMCTLVCFRFQT